MNKAGCKRYFLVKLQCKNEEKRKNMKRNKRWEIIIHM